MTLGKTLEVAIWRLKVSASQEITVDLPFNHRFSIETAVLQTFWYSKKWMENICKEMAFFFLFVLLLLLLVVVVFLFSQNHPFKTYLNYSQVRSFPRHSLELKRQRTVLPLQALFRHLHVGFWIVFISSSIALVRHSSQCLLWWKQTVNSLTQHPRSFLTIWHHDTQWFKLFSKIQHYVAIGSKVLSPTGKIQQSRLFQCQIFISDCEERQDGKMRKTNIPWSNLG